MNILVTGANGQLGRELRNQASGSPHRFIFSDVTSVPGLDTVFLDITNIDAVRLVAESEGVDVIVNCAAYTDVDRAEDDSAMAELLNHTAAGVLAKVCSERDSTLVHISTDYIFSGEGCVPYREVDAPSPRSVYGSTKLAGEESVLHSGCSSIILRTAWLYSPYGKNFVKTIARLVDEKEQIKVVFDQCGSPTYAADLAALIVKILDKNMTERCGVYHFTDEGAISWYDFAMAIRDLMGSPCEVLPCRSEDYPARARRPHYSVLDKSLVKETFDVKIPHWYDSLKECLERMK